MAGRRKLVPRTRGGGTMTEAGFWGFLRSGLRAKSRRWAPIYQCLAAAREPAKMGDHDKWGGRIKYVFRCAACNGRFPQKRVAVDHLVPAGSLRCYEDLPGFVERLFCEAEGLQVLCDDCHGRKTREDTGDVKSEE